MLYQASTAMKGEPRRSGTTPPPTADSPWQTPQNRPKRRSPSAIVVASAESGGGLSVSFGVGGRGGSWAAPPSLNARTRLTLRRLPEAAATLPPCNEKAEPPPGTTAL